MHRCVCVFGFSLFFFFFPNYDSGHLDISKKKVESIKWKSHS